MAEKPTYNDNVGLPDVHYNPLLNYRNVTYNTRLTMMSSVEATQTRYERSYDYKQGIVIWETGGAGSVYLEELDIEVAGSGNKTGNYVTQLPQMIKCKLVEPIGGRLLEELSLAAMDLGYKSNDGICLLEISFTGYELETDKPVICRGWDNEELTYKWYVRLNDVKMALDYKGATYDIELILNEGEALKADYMNLESGFRITSSPATIGEFCTEMANSLNKREEGKVKAGYRCIPHKYVINAHPDIANLKLSPSSLLKRIWLWAINLGEVQAKPNTPIQSFILGALANSDELMKYLHRIPEKKEYNSPDTKPGTSEFVIRNIAIVAGAKDIAKDKAYAFDDKLGSAAKEIHIYVTAKEDPRNVISPQEYKDAQDPAERSKRVDNWIKKGLLRKVYKWIYTGENLEVINTSIKLDYMWRNVRPLWIDSESGKAIAPAQTAPISKEKDPAAVGAKAITCNDAKTINDRMNRDAAVYAEDMEFNSKTKTIGPKPGWYPHMPQFYHMNTGVNQSSQQGALSKENANEFSIYRQIGANLSGSGEMVNLTLEVVGDPFWLMQVPSKPGSKPWQEDVWEYEKENLTEEKLVPYRKKTATQTWIPFIYFEAQVPSVDLDSADKMALRKSDAISGVYFTTKVTNKFVKGKFTTQLECAREQLSNPWDGKPSQSTKDKVAGKKDSGSTPKNAFSVSPNNAGPNFVQPEYEQDYDIGGP